MIKSATRFLFNERTLFYGALLYSIGLLLTLRFYPSMDGAGHLYNSKLIGHLLNGETPVVNTFFTFNPSIIPNWFSHFILSTCQLVMPAWAAEKVLLVIYLLGITLSFRWLMHELGTGHLSVSVIILPFAYSLLFHLGFYNYCFSFAFLFLTLAYWLRTRGDHSVSKISILLLLLTVTYFTAVLAFAFTGLCLGLLVIAWAIKDYSEGSSISVVKKKTLREMWVLLVASLPGIILATLFILNTRFSTEPGRIPSEELVTWLNDVRCLIVYEYKKEGNLTIQFLHLLIAILAIALFNRFRFANPESKGLRKFHPGDIFLIPLIVTLVLYFKTPNDAVAGMMSDRYCLQSYFLFILWVCAQPIPSRLGTFFAVLIVWVHVSLLHMKHEGALKVLNKDASTLAEASKILDANSVVLPVNMTDNWLQIHFSNYLGLEKPLVVLENYEATVGWFPVRWNEEQLPRVSLGDLERLPNLEWPTNRGSSNSIQIDYVCLYGNIANINDEQWAELKRVLDKNYLRIYVSTNHYIAIYKKYSPKVES